jgi:nitroreductase
MTRSFDGRAVDLTRLDELCAEALRAPTAGNSAGVSMVTVARDDVGGYFAAATDPTWRDASTRAPGLTRAGAVVIVLSEPATYLARYREADKVTSGLGDATRWSVPYWHTDAAMATMALLLLVEQESWAATLWGNFRHEHDVLTWCGAPAEAQLFGTVLVGYPDGHDEPSASLRRDTPSRRDRVRRFGSELS